MRSAYYLVRFFFVGLAIWISSYDNTPFDGAVANLRSHNIQELPRIADLHLQRQLSPGSQNGGTTVDEHAAEHPKLFMAISSIHIEKGTFSVFIIIAFIIVLKQIIEALYTLTNETPFYVMVTKIEEELMIVGTSSFLFKVILNTTSFENNEWAYPLEFGEILVPLIAFSYCGLGILLIIISLRQCYVWSRAHNLKVLEILDDYYQSTKSIWFR